MGQNTTAAAAGQKKPSQESPEEDPQAGLQYGHSNPEHRAAPEHRRPLNTDPEDNLIYNSIDSVAQLRQAEECVQKVPRATAQKVLTSAGQDGPEALPLYLWDSVHCTGLAYEIAERVFQKKQGPEIKELTRSLGWELESKIKEWDIKVQPNTREFKKVATAVSSDLLQGTEKKCLAIHAAVAPDKFNTSAMDSIHKHLVTPQQKKTSRFSSFLQSVRSFFCVPCTAGDSCPSDDLLV